MMVSVRVFPALLAMLVAAGCGGDMPLRRAELAEISSLLPGSYSSAQATADQTGSNLQIVPVYVPFIGDRVFYVQEIDSNDPRRVLAQRLIALDAVEKVGVVQRNFLLSEPARWRGGVQSPELFTSLMVRDVASLPGCDLIWKKSGRQFIAESVPGRCGSTGGRRSADSISVVQLSSTEFAQGESSGSAQNAQLSRFFRH